MKKIAIRANDNARVIVDYINNFLIASGSSLKPKRGDASEDSYYTISYEDKIYKIVDYTCSPTKPSHADYVFDTLPEFFSLHRSIQDALVKYSISNSPIPFIINIDADVTQGGFDWDRTPEGSDFWADVIANNDIVLFHKQFNLKPINLSKDESRLQEQESPLGGGSRELTGGICCRKHFPRVTVKSVGYKKVIGRG